MNYYQKHLGDYAKKTGHLTPLEHGVYNLILDGYYDREQGPTLIEATRWARARTEDEKAAVQAVLDEFFIAADDDGRYRQSRVEHELADYRARAETNRAIAVERERRKKERQEHAKSTNRAPDVHHDDNQTDQIREPSHKPIANSQEPYIKTLSAQSTDAPIVDGDGVVRQKAEKKPKYTEEDERCAEWIFERILKTSPQHSRPKLGKWADDVRLLREGKKVTHREICALFGWAHDDDFWRANILSPAKLREKWDQLNIKRGTPQKGQQHGNFGAQDYRAGVGADGSF